MEENFNWNLASNAQLKEECERLENEFSEKQQKMKDAVKEIDDLNESLKELSRQYVDIKNILNKREGKKTS